MGWFSSCCSFVSSCISAVGRVASSVGSFIAGTASSLLSVAGKYLNPVCSIIEIVAKIIGLLNENETPEELGDKAIRADKKPEDFDSINEYINYLREEIQFDSGEFEKLSKEDKTVRKAVGSAILVKGINEKKDTDIPLETWVAMGKLNLQEKSNEINAILDNFKKEEYGDFAKYVDGNLSPDKELEVGQKLVDMYKKIYPDLSENELEQKVKNMEKGE